MRACIFTLALCVFCSSIFADEVWQPVTGIKESDIKEVTIKDHIVYASSDNSLYRSDDNGKTWNTVFTARGDFNVINFIAVSGERVFVCTQNGLFKSNDGRTNWKKIFKGVGIEENDISHIAFSGKEDIYLGTKSGLFTSNDNGTTWQKDSDGVGNLSMRWISFLDDIALVAAETGVYRKIESGWKRIFVTQTEEAEYDSDTSDAQETAIRPVNSIFTKDKNIFLATDDGIFISKDKGESWQRFESAGLGSEKISRILFKNSLYAATDKGLYRLSQNYNAGLISEEEKDILAKFSHEPGIREVQEAAIIYAEVHPDKIKQWRSAASKKALLPDVSVGVDRYVTDYWHWDSGTNPDTLQKGDDTLNWDVTMTWDLGELIWNDDQTSIDTRSRPMVQTIPSCVHMLSLRYLPSLLPNSLILQKLESSLFLA